MTVVKPGEWTYTDKRAYQRNLYSVPYEIRQFMKAPSGRELYYIDLSNAELYILGWFYHDQVLLADIDSGHFWDMWVQPGFPKADVKKNLFCMQYSASNITFVPSTPADFFEKFTTRYNVWWEGITRTARTWETTPRAFVGRYKDITTGAMIELPDPAEGSKSLFKLLNYRISSSLSSYAQIFFAEICKWNQTNGGENFNLNFDSLTVSVPGKTFEEYLGICREIQDKLVAEGKLPCKIPFKGAKGKNWAEAQGWEE